MLFLLSIVVWPPDVVAGGSVCLLSCGHVTHLLRKSQALWSECGPRFVIDLCRFLRGIVTPAQSSRKKRTRTRRVWIGVRHRHSGKLRLTQNRPQIVRRRAPMVLQSSSN
jgi:hypothetical protein